jgi:hypothetical protein
MAVERGLGAEAFGVAMDFTPGKRTAVLVLPSVKAKGLMIFPPPTLYLSLWVCVKAAYVSEHSSGFVTPSAPRGSHEPRLPSRQENNRWKEESTREEKV